MWKIAEIVMLVYMVYGAYFDIKKRELPGEYLIAGTAHALISQVFWGGQAWYVWGLGLLTGMIFMVLSNYTNEGIGYADSMMIMNLGIFYGVWTVLILLAIAFTLAALTAVAGSMLGKCNRNTKLPFIPFLAAGYLGVML